MTKSFSGLNILGFLLPLYEYRIQTWSFTTRFLRWLTFLWLFIGLIALFSASYAVGLEESGDGWYYFKRQAIWIWIGIIFFKIIIRLPLKNLLKASPWIYLFVMGLILATVFGFGTNINGAERWLAIGPIQIQPSEFLKPFLVLQGASVFGTWERKSWTQRGVWLGIFAMTLLLILLQPNLSTTALCGMTLWFIALGAGLPLWQLMVVAIGGIVMAVISISHNEYQWLRITSFRNPWADPKETGYQLIQSLLAIGSGGKWGVGFGMSQQKLFYLPIQYTDFIFAVFAEEFGFVGGITLLLLISLYATIAFFVALQCFHPIKRLVAIGVMVILVGQSLLNIAVATGSIPTTGLPFPLFSYGGSSVMSSLMLAGLLIRVARENEDHQQLS
jgi:cell division protein FtsW